MLTTDSLYIQCLMVNRLLSVASMEPVMSPIHCGNLKRTGRLEGKVSCHLIRNHPKPKPTFSYCLPKTTDRSPFSSHKRAWNHRFFGMSKSPAGLPSLPSSSSSSCMKGCKVGATQNLAKKDKALGFVL